MGKHEIKGVTGFCRQCGMIAAARKKFCSDCLRKRGYDLKSRNREKISTYYMEWYKKNGRTRNPNSIEITKNWALRNPEKVMARTIVRLAVKEGQVKKPSRCEKCRKKHHYLHGHHADYDKPFFVMWLCPSCHKLHHNKIK